MQALLHDVVVIGILLLVAFACLVTLALLLRRHRESHRRLMYLALLTTLPPALGGARWLGKTFAEWLPSAPSLIVVTVGVFLAALAIHDGFTLRRIHGVTLWGGLALLLIVLSAGPPTAVPS